MSTSNNLNLMIQKAKDLQENSLKHHKISIDPYHHKCTIVASQSIKIRPKTKIFNKTLCKSTSPQIKILKNIIKVYFRFHFRIIIYRMSILTFSKLH